MLSGDKSMLSGGDKKYDIGSDPLPPLWDEFRSSGNIELYERPLKVERLHTIT